MPEQARIEVSRLNREFLVKESRLDFDAAARIGAELVTALHANGAGDAALQAVHGSLGRIAVANGQFRTALEELGHCLRYTRAKYGKQDLNTARVQGQLARVHFFLDEHDKASKHYEGALRTYRSKHADLVVETARLLLGEGDIHLATDVKKAVHSFTSARTMLLKNHANTIEFGRASLGLAEALAATNNRKAPGAYQQAIELLTSLTSPVDSMTVRACLGLARLQLRSGEAAAAKTQLEVLLSKTRSLVGVRDREVVDVSIGLATVLVAMGELEKANTKLLAAMPSAEVLQGDVLRSARLLSLRSALTRSCGDLESGAELRAQALDLYGSSQMR